MKQLHHWSVKLLRLFCPSHLQEEIEGDLMQRFERDVERLGTKNAKQRFFWNTIRYFRLSILLRNRTKKFKSTGMVRSHIKIAGRQLFKHKTFTSINVLGMCLALTIAILILLYVRFETSYESSNPLADQIVRISMDYFNGNTMIDQDAEMYPLVAPRMAAEFPEVKSFVRATPVSETIVRIGEESFNETEAFAVDSNFFKLFNYKLLFGNPNNIFSSPYEIALTESQALKYFNRKNVVGKSLWVGTVNHLCTITGVVADNPLNTHFKFDLLLSLLSFNERIEKWGWQNNDTYTYLLLSENVDYPKFLSKLDVFNDQLHQENKILHEKIIAQPIKDIHLYSHKSFEIGPNGDADSVFILLGVAMLVIIIAIVNYINLSTSRSLDRAKEVAVRKVVGSSKSQLRVQFFTESLLVNLLAGVLAIVLIFIATPAFRYLSGLPSAFTFWNDTQFWCLFILVIAGISFLAGIFPAFVLSAFEPITALKGKFTKSPGGIVLRKSLVVFQFAITLFLLIQTLVASEQITFMKEKELGLNIKSTLVIKTPDNIDGRRITLKDQLSSQTQFRSVTLSSTVPGRPTNSMASTNVGVRLAGSTEETTFNYYIYWIDSDFIPTMEMKLKAGENFHSEKVNDDEIIVSEEAINILGIDNAESAVGKTIVLWDKERTIIGVLENFHQGSPKDPFIPLLFLHQADGWLTSVRFESGSPRENLATIEETFHKVFPDSPFEYFFLDQEFDNLYRSDEQFQSVFGVLTGLAVVISSLGLFGLVSFTVATRKKEVSIRKVLGANVRQIAALLYKDFIYLILIAVSTSVVITYFLIQTWLERYAFRIEINIFLFMIPIAGIMAISLVTILFETFKVSTSNPIDSLKDG